MNIGQNQYGMPYRNSQWADYSQRTVGNMGRGVREEEETAAQSEESKSCREQLLAEMEKMEENIKNGTIQPKFRIGAQEYTIHEWEKLLQKFDAAEEVLREEVRAQIEEAEKKAEEEALKRAAMRGEEPESVTVVSDSASPAAASVTATAGTTAATAPEAVGTASATAPDKATETMSPEETAALLTDEVRKCSYPTDDPKQKHWYITCFGPDGISCKEAYFDGTKWVNKNLWGFSYTEKGQYEKVMAFLQRFPADANLRFAAHENFWKDFLAGKIDEDDFTTFFRTTKDGVPDYTYEKDGSTYIDENKVKYAKYMNTPGARMYTDAEMKLILQGILHENMKNTKNMEKLSDYGGAMTMPEGTGKGADAGEEDLETQIVTKPDGSTVLQIATAYGVTELEITQAQRFGLMLDMRRSYGAAEPAVMQAQKS